MRISNRLKEYRGVSYRYTVCATEDAGIKALAGVNFDLGATLGQRRCILATKQFSTFEEAEETTEDSARLMIDNFHKTGVLE